MEHRLANDKSINCENRGLIFVSCCSLFSHSCVQNVEALFVEKQKYVLISNQPIKKGKQVKTIFKLKIKYLFLAIIPKVDLLCKQLIIFLTSNTFFIHKK